MSGFFNRRVVADQSPAPTWETTMNEQKKAETAARLDEWLAMTRALLAATYPNARWASLVVNIGDGLPSPIFPVIAPPEVPGATDELTA